jgi:hypothetical protein
VEHRAFQTFEPEQCLIVRGPVFRNNLAPGENQVCQALGREVGTQKQDVVAARLENSPKIRPKDCFA